MTDSSSSGPMTPIELDLNEYYDARTKSIVIENEELPLLESSIFAEFSHVQSVTITNCQLEELPASLFSLEALIYLDISQNCLSFIPAEIGYFKNLQMLKISGNPGATIQPLCDFIDQPDEMIKILQKAAEPVKFNFSTELKYVQKVQSNRMMSLVSYNTLAPRSSIRSRYPFCPSEYLAFENRLPHMLDMLKEFNADVFCLQEVEGFSFNDHFSTTFTPDKYEGLFSPKGRIENYPKEFKKYVLGQATFINSSEFEVVESINLEFRKSRLKRWAPLRRDIEKRDETALITLFKTKSKPERYIVLANVHLFWVIPQGSLRASQLQIALESAVSLAHEYTADFDIIITGDFNSPPDTPPLKYMETHPMDFKSVYKELAKDPEFSIYSFNFQNTVDHIFYTDKHIKPVAYLPLPSKEEVNRDYFSFPTNGVPSDHLPIACAFEVN